jgi:sulfoxide reductase heme-binding subunit YedZ
MPKIRWGKVLLFAACLTPLCWLGWRAWNRNLTANPIEFITHFTGDWTIRLVVATLAVTPLRKLLNLPSLIRYRRPIGLFAFFYGSLHFLTYIWLDKFFDLHDIVKDVAKRPFITAGFTAFVCMAPLAITSTAGWIRRLGGKRWQKLHRLIYLTAIAGVAHYYWLVKSDVRLPVLYGTLVGVELAYRVIVSKRRRPAAPRAPVGVGHARPLEFLVRPKGADHQWGKDPLK